jgi:hypothetical protein
MQEADVDIMVVLDGGCRRRGPRAVLDLVKDTLREQYQTSQISRNRQAVTIRFSDFTVDVVPAFGIWWESGVLDICNSGDGSWIRTSPQKHIEISGKVNKRADGLVVPAVKMLKASNRTAGWPLRSFHLEVLAWKVLDPLARVLVRRRTRPWARTRSTSPGSSPRCLAGCAASCPIPRGMKVTWARTLPTGHGRTPYRGSARRAATLPSLMLPWLH